MGAASVMDPSTSTGRVQSTSSSQNVAGSSETLGRAEELDENLAYFQRENEEYIDYWSNAQRGAAELEARMESVPTKQESEWGDMQRSWDAFEATTWGIRPVPQYQFQPHNPYLRGDSSQKTMHHGMHSSQAMHEVCGLAPS